MCSSDLVVFFSLPLQPANSRKKSSRHSSKYKSGSSQERENESEQGYISDDDKHSRPVFTEDTESPTVSAVLLTVISIIILLIFIILANLIFEYKWPNHTMTRPTHSTCIVVNMVAFSKIWCGKAMCCHSDNKFNSILYETTPLI